jgi:methylenetetrahydrofolate dehydrogenase (NADP+)/methenyltetrahydrofolate cyclohydrolase
MQLKNKIINGKKLSRQIKEEIKDTVAHLDEKPGLSVVLVGENPASKVYVSYKHKACEEVGINSIQVKMPKETTEEELFEKLDKLNNDEQIHGILVQLPLPKHLKHLEDQVLEYVNPIKDVDGFHPVNSGKLFSARGGVPHNIYVPATPKGILTMIKEYGLEIEGKEVVVIGRSNLVGKPVAMLFMLENGTVTICHSRTKDLIGHAQKADILIVAVGRPEFVTADYVKRGAIVIDVGINRVDDKLVGDVAFKEVKEKAKAITPVPGGVGPMTIASLLQNTMIAYKNIKNHKED